MDLHKLNNKFVSVYLKHFWCTDKPWAYTDSQDSPRPRLGGITTFPLTVSSMIAHRGCTQMSFFPGLSSLWKPITSLYKPLIEERSKAKI